MKKNVMCRFTAGALAAVMILTTAACSGQNESPEGSSGSLSAAADPSGSAPEQTEAPKEPEIDMSPLSISVELTSAELHIDPNPAYDRLVKEINDYTRMDITWVWKESSGYYDALDLRFTSGDVSDVMIVRDSATFRKAAGEGLFWELTDYIDDYDNLRIIPEGVRNNASYNGRLYGIPRSRTLARHGFGYRLDWLNNLGLKEPTDWESFKKMLYEFTYSDPDGNGVDDTMGLFLDSWTGGWDIMMTWFGVPNVWGLDANGDLIHKSQTDEYKTALAAFRELYSLGVINNGSRGIPDFRDVTAGKAVFEGLQASHAGCGVQVLDELRKVQTEFEKQGMTTEEELMFTLGGYVDTGRGPLCWPTTGYNNMIAISKKSVKTEKDLKRVLQFLNDLNDGECLNLIELGWENESYYVDSDGYAIVYDAETKAANGIPAGHNSGFQNISAGFTAPENARPVEKPPYTSAIRVLEQKLYDEDIPYCVFNYGAGYLSSTYSEHASELDVILNDAQLKYIVGEIDEAGLEAALKQWLSAGGEAVTKEMNDLYHAAGN